MKIRKDETTQQREIRFTGLSRSGNHAIINWVIKQLNGSYCFLNCTEPKHNPYLSARPLNRAGDVLETNIGDLDLQAEQQGNFSKKSHLLYSHEDCFLGPLHHKVFRTNHNSWVGKSEKFNDVLILRDPFNLFASRIKSGLIAGHYTHHGARPISLITLRRIYKQHARAFLGDRNFLRNKILINYNLWASSAEYRRQLAQELEINFSDEGFEEVAQVAGGSSFDGIKLSGKASSMKLHSRWESYAEKEHFWDLFDDELVELSSRIFGEIAPIEFYRENFSKNAVLS
ncbi:MAG: hypothetical protein WBL27_03095 [Salinimicrobium sp.]